MINFILSWVEHVNFYKGMTRKRYLFVQNFEGILNWNGLMSVKLLGFSNKCVYLCYLYFVFIMFFASVHCCLWSPAGKDWPLGSRLWCLIVFLLLSHVLFLVRWYLIVLIPDLCPLSYFSNECVYPLRFWFWAPFRVCARFYFSFATIFANLNFFAPFSWTWSQIFGHFSPKKERPGFWAFLLKCLLSLTPNSGGLFYAHWYNKYGIVHFVFKAVDSLKIDVYLYLS